MKVNFPNYSTDRLEAKVAFRLRVISVVSILILSLLGGFVWGLRAGPTPAEALIAPELRKKSWKPTLIVAPSYLELNPVGENSEINGKPAESAVFSSDRDVKTVAAEIVGEWQKQGYFASGVAYKDRGAAFGMASNSALRVSLGVWRNSETGRTEGVLGASLWQDGVGNSEIREIAGVPFPSGAKVGAIYKSNEKGETNWSGSLTTQGSINEVASWFRRSVTSQGWKPLESSSDNFLQFNKTGEELTLIFVKVSATNKSPEQVSVSIIKHSLRS